MGIVWSSRDESTSQYVAQIIWNALLRCGLCYMLFEAIFIAVANSAGTSSDSRRLMWVLLGVTYALQSITLMFSIHDMSLRLKSKVSSVVVQNLNQALKSTYLVLVISLVLGIVPFIIGFALRSSEVGLYIVLMFANTGSGLILTAAMFFISLDCAVATSLLDQLIQQQKLEILTCEQFILARDEVKCRHNTSMWVNNSIVLVALLDVCCVLLFSFVNLLNANIQGYLIVTGLFLKEIPFLMVVFWQLAQVNEKSAQLVKDLGAKKWSMESHIDHERVSVYINAQSNPIVMSLAGMKLKRRDLAWQFALWCVAFVVSFLKAAVEKRVD